MKGKLLRGLLNDLKRRPEDASKELDISVEKLNAILDGKLPLYSELEEKIYQIWPLSPRDLGHIHDDCPTGIIICRQEDSAASSRTMYRAGKPYYEYRDTAMSQCSNYRPEWIKQLCEVEDNDPENPEVQWNNGHFMHQFTYFVGPVNFYYLDENNRKQVAVMDTGDSVYITSFVPHTFTTRKNEGGGGYILAVTYGHLLSGDVRFELGSIGHKKSASFVHPSDSKALVYASQLKHFMGALSMPTSVLVKETGLSPDIIDVHLAGKEFTELYEIQLIAKALKVNLRDLLPYDETDKPVMVSKHADCRQWQSEQGGYTFTELASHHCLANSKSLEIVVNNETDELFETKLHQYFYNLSESDLTLKWLDENDELAVRSLAPGDSFYSKPNTKMALSGQGKGIVVRIPGRISTDAIRELSLIGEKHLNRVIIENVQWFDPKGSN